VVGRADAPADEATWSGERGELVLVHEEAVRCREAKEKRMPGVGRLVGAQVLFRLLARIPVRR